MDILDFGKTLNDLDDRLPKGRSDCFDVGMWGGCGIECPVFLRGDCGEPQELKDELNELDEEDREKVIKAYDCFNE
jgi:hypothetical protein